MAARRLGRSADPAKTSLPLPLLLLPLVHAWDPWNLCPRPPMGFANWNGFGCNYNDTTFRQQADFLVSSGMAAAVQSPRSPGLAPR